MIHCLHTFFGRFFSSLTFFLLFHHWYLSLCGFSILLSFLFYYFYTINYYYHCYFLMANSAPWFSMFRVFLPNLPILIYNFLKESVFNFVILGIFSVPCVAIFISFVFDYFFIYLLVCLLFLYTHLPCFVFFSLPPFSSVSSSLFYILLYSSPHIYPFVFLFILVFLLFILQKLIFLLFMRHLFDDWFCTLVWHALNICY